MSEPAQAEDVALRYSRAVDALNRGDWAQAQTLSMPLLRELPGHAGIHFTAGVAALRLRQLPLAMQCLERATLLNPQRADYQAQWAGVLASVSRMGAAVQAADRAVSLGPSDATTLGTLGTVYAQVNAYEKAVVAFAQAVALAPTVATYRYNLGMSLLFSGEIEAAEREFEACLAIDARHWKAHYSLAQLRPQSAAHNHLERLQSLLPHVGDDADAQMCLHLALAKEYDDLEDHSRSFAHLVRGKSAGAAGHGYSIRRDEALFAALEQAFPSPQPGVDGTRSDAPIFVFGMPRSGTTLVERILSSHPEVHSAGELQNFALALKNLSGSTTPALIDPETVRMGRSIAPDRLGARYLASTRPMAGRTPHFIDKLPHNFLYAGFIAQALPDARLICVRRNPMDTCVGNFRQGFARSLPWYDYSYNLLDTGRYYILFDRLMKHWQRVLPGQILEIDYETIVDAQEDSSRRLLGFCGLPWDDACLRVEQNPAPASTASAVQVRSPIHRAALNRWKRYEPQLTELKALLADAGIAIDD
jgi:tetratricopeptide (TPR) repeat protein